MAKTSTLEANEAFADVLKRASSCKERVILTRRGKKLAAVIPVEDLELLEELEDRMDVESAKAALAESTERVPYEVLRRELGLE